jgi:hypothetical protein
MSHWMFTEEIKDAARIRRRREAKATIARELNEAAMTSNKATDPTFASGTSRAGHEPRHR